MFWIAQQPHTVSSIPGRTLRRTTAKKLWLGTLVPGRGIQPLGLESWAIAPEDPKQVRPPPPGNDAAGSLDLRAHRLPKLQGEERGSSAYVSKIADPPILVVQRQRDIGTTRLLSLLLPGEVRPFLLRNKQRADLVDSYSEAVWSTRL